MMEEYYRYLYGCRLVNQFELPEKGWDKHHILPQSLFKGLGPTIWLSPEQHAIASILQSYAFNRVCVTGWMKKHLSQKWIPAWLYWRRIAQKIRSHSVPQELRGEGVKKFWSELSVEEKTQRALIANKHSTKSIAITLPSGEVKIFKSMREAARNLPIAFSTVNKMFHNPELSILGYQVKPLR
jgi:hypothetical protein